jgi:hypothetical protein
MAALCGRFGVSRTTACRILQRHNSCVWRADRLWRRPYRHANRLPVRIETLVVCSKQELSGQRRGYGGAGAALSGYLCSGDQYGACRSGPPWAGQAQGASA